MAANVPLMSAGAPRTIFATQVLTASFQNSDDVTIKYVNYAAFIGYLRGAVGGGFAMRINWNGNFLATFRDFGGAGGNELVIDAPRFISTLGTEQRITVPIRNPGGAGFLNIQFVEIGVPGTPGTLSCRIAGMSVGGQ